MVARPRGTPAAVGRASVPPRARPAACTGPGVTAMSFAQGVYAGITASSLLLIIGVAASGRRTPSTRLVDAPTRDPWEIAFLAGGPARVADAAIATLHEDGRSRSAVPAW